MLLHRFFRGDECEAKAAYNRTYGIHRNADHNSGWTYRLRRGQGRYLAMRSNSYSFFVSFSGFIDFTDKRIGRNLSALSADPWPFLWNSFRQRVHSDFRLSGRISRWRPECFIRLPVWNSPEGYRRTNAVILQQCRTGFFVRNGKLCFP